MYSYLRPSICLSAALVFICSAACYGFQTRDAEFSQGASTGSAETASVGDASPGDSNSQQDSEASTSTSATTSEGESAETDSVGTSGSDTGECDAPMVLCDDICINPDTDAANCGAGPDCIGGQSCAADQSCIDGVCHCTPDCAGLECGVDPVCGQSCGTCTGDNTCTDGTCSCVADCDDRECGPDGCGGSCGACDGMLACTDEGSCGCTDDQTACGERCVDLDSDTQHCGACDNECRAGSHADAKCSDAECSMECDGGWMDCDGRKGNGCEASDDDPETCGSCDNDCGNLPHSDTACDEKSCVYECDDDWGNCDDDWDDGCEVNLTTVDDCGQCGLSCDDASDHMTAACEEERRDWKCVYACEDGWGDCDDDDDDDGCETKLDTTENCGACDNTCEASENCEGGTCKCDPMCNDRECGDDPGGCMQQCGRCDDGFTCDEGPGECIED